MTGCICVGNHRENSKDIGKLHFFQVIKGRTI